MKRLLSVSLSLALLSLAASASAEVYELETQKIVVKPARPLVTEIAKPPAPLAVPKTHAPVLPKIAEAVSSGPF